MSDTDSTYDPNEVGEGSRDLLDFDSDATYDPTEEEGGITKENETKAQEQNNDRGDTAGNIKMKKVVSKTHDISDSDSDTVDLELSRSSSKIQEISSDSDPDNCFINKNVNNKTCSPSKSKSPLSISKQRTVSPSLNKEGKNKGRSKSPLGSKNQAGTSKEGRHRLEKADTLQLNKASPKARSSSPAHKPLCPYGSKCYRKNPSHFKEFSHPKDLDLKRKLSSDADCDSPFKKVRHTDQALAGPSGSDRGTPLRSADMSHLSDKALSGKELYTHAQPYSFFLTKVSGIKPLHNNSGAVSLKDILHPSMGNLVKSAQFNYMFEIPWIVDQYPAQFRKKPLLLIHGFTRGNKAALDMDASVYDHIRLCQARLDIMYGTHHSKMMFLQYDSGMRVVISTANLIQQDWHQKSQGVWISPVFPKQSSPNGGDSTTHFKQDLLQYLNAYRAKQLTEWIEIIRHHDMSQANVHLISSIPGRHTGDLKHAFGHLKLRKLLEKTGPDPQKMKSWPVIGQFSSIGSLGPSEDNWLCGEFYTSLSSAKGGGTSLGGNINKLKLIYPSKDNVRTSLEGYPAGCSLPYSINTAKKQTYLHKFLHQWRSDVRGRSRASPHIKSYCRVSPENDYMAWFLITSANLSKAAWGALEKKGSQLMIRSYEIGVMFLPNDFDKKSETFSVLHKSKSQSGHLPPFPQPYDLPITPYTKSDQPWIYDIPYTNLPDSNGNMWCPQ